MANDQSQDVRHQMEEVRAHLKHNIEGVIENVETLADWKSVIKRHPWACLSAAAALGYVAVPRRRPDICTDVETLAQLVERYRPPQLPEASRLTPGGVAVSLASMVGNSLLRAGMLYAIQQLAQWCQRRSGAHETLSEPTANGSPTTSCQPH